MRRNVGYVREGMELGTRHRSKTGTKHDSQMSRGRVQS